ncbi:hypothetical protein ACFFWD_25470 [Bradyrhizobium erythrophlei]|uniref:hypothetical protein n=1 Tax=Bradyrhizobium erythrophlei TaxID=1437360 RepID=UPI0035ED691E
MQRGAGGSLQELFDANPQAFKCINRDVLALVQTLDIVAQLLHDTKLAKRSAFPKMWCGRWKITAPRRWRPARERTSPEGSGPGAGGLGGIVNTGAACWLPRTPRTPEEPSAADAVPASKRRHSLQMKVL